MSQLLWDLAKTAFGKPNDIQLDTQILRLHSRISFRVFLICSLMLTIRQVIGTEDIMCYDHGQTKDDTLNAHCWIHSTYSVRELFHVCSVYRDCVYPGVGKVESDSTTNFHYYYQWTSIVLCINAFISYIPRFLWKSFENGLQRTLSYDRRLAFYPMIPEDEDDGGCNHKQHMQNVVSYFKTHRGQHQSYFYKYCCCEFLGFLCTVVNFVLTDLLLSHQFFNFGSEVLKYWLQGESFETVSPMIKVFPLMGKCDWKRYGPSGNIVPKDPVCVLPLNALNDKIYLFLWFYLTFVMHLSALAFLYRLCTIFFKKFRFILLKHRSAPGQLKEKILEDLCDRSYVGDWFVMYMFNKNVSGIFFQEFLEIYWEELLNRKLSV